MKKEIIVQFVCFVTDLEPDDFVPEWEQYAKRLMSSRQETTLQQHAAETKHRFRYISQHVWPDRDFHFTFMNQKQSEHFPEHNVRVVQAGGYVPLHLKKKYNKENDDVKLIAFISHNETDMDFYHSLPLYRHLTIHQAYFESCSYGHVMEFFVPEIGADELLLRLKQRPGVETGIYKECLVPHLF